MRQLSKILLRKRIKLKSSRYDIYGGTAIPTNIRGRWIEIFYQELGWYNQRILSICLKNRNVSLSLYDPKRNITKGLLTDSPSFIGFRYKDNNKS